MRNSSKLIVVAVGLVCASCASAVSEGSTTPFILTSTLPPKPSPSAPAIPATSVATSTLTPIQGTTSTQVNVRADPSSASPPIGVLDAYWPVAVVGRDPSGNWYQVQYPKTKDGLGWVTSQYINVQDKEGVRVVAGIPGTEPVGVVLQQVYVRSAPGTEAATLGILNARDLVAVIGKSPDDLWLQVRHANSPGGTGWIAAGYIQVGGLGQLPVVGQSGQVVGTATPGGILPTASPTPGIAPDDNDSAASPAANLTLSSIGTTAFMYSSDLSAPDGDTSDWIRFTPDAPRLVMQLDCTGSGPIELSLSLDGADLTSQGLPGCSASNTLDLSPGSAYVLKLAAHPLAGQQEYVRYTVVIQSTP